MESESERQLGLDLTEQEALGLEVRRRVRQLPDFQAVLIKKSGSAEPKGGLQCWSGVTDTSMGGGAGWGVPGPGASPWCD